MFIDFSRPAGRAFWGDQVRGLFDRGVRGVWLDVNEPTTFPEAGGGSSVPNELVVEGELKIGHFAVAFEDATIPLGGIPITVTRAYDTRRAHESLHLGYGWSVDYQAMRVQESRPVGAR